MDSCCQSLGHSEKRQLTQYLGYLGETINLDEIQLIREGLQRNQLTGNHRFVDEIESRIGRRVEQRGRGRPRNEENICVPFLVEIKTGKRKLIEFFLSPLLRYKQESVRER